MGYWDSSGQKEQHTQGHEMGSVVFYLRNKIRLITAHCTKESNEVQTYIGQVSKQMRFMFYFKGAGSLCSVCVPKGCLWLSLENKLRESI